MSSLKDMVVDGKKARFAFFRDSALHYETECGFLFSIPVEDAGSATFNTEEKAVHLMRWIRKQLASNEADKAAQDGS